MLCVAYIPLALDHGGKPNTRLYTLLNATLNHTLSTLANIPIEI